ncbi:hypothetical protein [Actinokineospora diospyrosa]|uniref:Secreted protein n=1 Tax=Actinokineospora diospyrosa TaxID=103728 RepID=A0ABT1I662_9PSEU|nr:hypothetical protein [Actinokineospora diospyrosa]MCP2268124.1 hypothetical protein [Actinokineospora diospyrosa]
MRRTPALAAVVLTAAALVSGAATATATTSGDWASGFEGPWTTQAECDATSDLWWSPPVYYSYDCSYHASDPGYGNRGPGWYFIFLMDIR